MITVKEEFLTSEKTIRAMRDGGPAVVVMWLALKGYAARKNTGGFIPDEAVDDLQGAPRRSRVLLKALVECGLPQRDGARGPGLVDKIDHGWQLHDYDDHGTSQTDEEIRREKAKLKKRRQREEREAELARLRGANSSPPANGDNRGQCPGDDMGTEADSVPGTENRDLAGAPARTRAPAGSQPSPAQPSRSGLSADLKSPPESAVVSGLAGRLVVRGTDPDGRPRPRHDPSGQKLAFLSWWPSQAMFDWARFRGLPDARFDEALQDAQAKLRGPGQFDWWDTKVMSFIEAAIGRHAVTSADDVTEIRRKREAGEAAASRRHIAAMADLGVAPLPAGAEETGARVAKLAEGM